MSVVMLTREALLRASLIISMFLSHKVAIPAVSCLLSGRVASGLRDLTYLIMLGSWTAETGSVEPPIQRARNLSDLSCFSLDQSSTSSFNVKSNIYNFSSENYLSLPLLGDRCPSQTVIKRGGDSGLRPGRSDQGLSCRSRAAGRVRSTMGVNKLLESVVIKS